MPKKSKSNERRYNYPKENDNSIEIESSKKKFSKSTKSIKNKPIKKRNINIKKGNGKNILMNKSNTIIFMIII